MLSHLSSSLSRVILILNTIIVLIGTGCSNQGKNRNLSSNRVKNEARENYSKVINSGQASGTQYYTKYDLSGENGEKIVFSVKNNSKVDVEIFINKESSVIKADSEGSISTIAGKTFVNYVFRVIPTPNGGEIDISYKISQE